MLRLVQALLVAAFLLAVSTARADFVLRDLDGAEHRLSALQGKWVVINFWATWCPPCIHEMPELERFHQQHKDQDAVVWGVTFEDTAPGDLRKFVAELGVTYPILGSGADPRTPYGTVRVLPTTFLVDPQGELAKKFEGPITADDLNKAIAANAPKQPARQLTQSQ